jgi:hypothetical protein
VADPGDAPLARPDKQAIAAVVVEQPGRHSSFAMSASSSTTTVTAADAALEAYVVDDVGDYSSLGIRERGFFGRLCCGCCG